MAHFKKWFLQCDGDCTSVVDSDEYAKVPDGWVIVEVVSKDKKRFYCPRCWGLMQSSLYVDRAGTGGGL